MSRRRLSFGEAFRLAWQLPALWMPRPSDVVPVRFDRVRAEAWLAMVDAAQLVRPRDAELEESESV